MLSERIHYLADRYFSNTCTAEEKEELAQWVNQAGEDASLQTLLEAAWLKHQASLEMPEDMSERITGKMFGETKQAPVHSLLWGRVAVAAAIMLALGTGTYYLFFNRPEKTTPVVQPIQQQDVPAPVASRATITMGDGQKLYLDSARKGTLANQNGVQLEKLADGQINYRGSTTEIVYNTLSNPRGSRVIHITLADGSRVWLNAGSSLTYPVAFAGSERKVQVNGEAYFEIAHNATKPFIVSKETTSVTVLGTHFNVKAYDEEKDIRVTLLEGSVQVKAGIAGKGVILKPGEQAGVEKDNRLAVFRDIDTEAVLAWKNGRFRFAGSGIEETLREIARWYDVEIIYEGKPSEQHFGGGISRNVPVSRVFEMLENTGVLQVKIEGKKIIVLP